MNPRIHVLRNSLCAVVAGLALLGGTMSAQADQNNRRDRGAQSAARQTQAHQAQSHRNDRSHGRADRGRNDRGRDHQASHGNRSNHRSGGHHHSGHGNHNNHGHHNRHGHSGHSDFHFEIRLGSPAPRYCPPQRPVVVHHHHTHHAPRPTFAQLEYQRGVEAGRCAGFDAGKFAGLSCLVYCDDVTVCLDAYSSHFRAGYFAAYGSAYREGFLAGQHERTHHLTNPTRYRTTSRW